MVNVMGLNLTLTKFSFQMCPGRIYLGSDVVLKSLILLIYSQGFLNVIISEEQLLYFTKIGPEGKSQKYM